MPHPLHHFLVNSILAAGLYLLNLADSTAALTIVAAGVLIDVDHLPEVVGQNFREMLRPSVFFNIRRFKDAAKKSRQNYLLLFHTVESLALLFALSFFVPALLFIAVGFLVHVVTDFLYTAYVKKVLKEDNGHLHQHWFLTPFILHWSLRTDDVQQKTIFHRNDEKCRNDED